MRTYLVERKIPQHGFEVLEYYGRLSDAKELVDRYSLRGDAWGLRSLTIEGPRFGEGYHVRRLEFDAATRAWKKGDV